MKKIIFSLCLVVLLVFSIVNIPKAYAYPQDIDTPFYDKMLLVSTTNDTMSDMYFLISAYEYSKQIAWDFVDFYNGKTLVKWDYNYYTDYATTISTLKSSGVITEYNYPIDGLYYYIDLGLAWATVGFGTGQSWTGNVMGAIVLTGTYNSYNNNGVVLNYGHIKTGPAKTGYSIVDIALMIVNTQTRYYQNTINNLDIEEIEYVNWKEGITYGVEYAYRHGFGPFYPELGVTNEGSYSYKLGNEEGQTSGFNGFQLVLGFIFSAIGLIGSIEILPALPIWYIIGIPIVFGLIFFITGKGGKK